MNFSVDIPPQTYSPGCFRAWTIPPPFSHGVGHSLLPTLPFGALVVTRRPCSDFTDMLWRLTNRRIIIMRQSI